MEQYIYIFTILLEIYVGLQIGFAILKADKKVLALNAKVLEHKDTATNFLKKTRANLEKFNKITGWIIKFKNSATRKVVMQLWEIVEIYTFIKTLRSYKDLSKFKILKKMLSYSFIKEFFGVIKQFV